MLGRKSGFLTFCFSLLPGAGEMYLGLMKQGLSIMSVFFFVVSLSAWLEVGVLLFILPVIWFYSFFHVHNLRSLPDHEFYAIQDEYLFYFERFFPKGHELDKKIRVVLAILLMVIGMSAIWDNMMNMIYAILPYYIHNFLSNFMYTIPKLAVAVILVLFGFWMIRGKKQELDDISQEQYNEKDNNF
jgi:putative Mn2+ efflux pump MntP